MEIYKRNLSKYFSISDYLVANIKPYKDEYGFNYRAAVTLREGTFLPSVIFSNPNPIIDKFTKKLAVANKDELECSLVIRELVEQETRINEWDIVMVEPSPYAWPLELTSLINEYPATRYVFTVLMKDNKLFYYCPIDIKFLDLPEGYTHSDIVEIHNGKVLIDGLEVNYFAEREIPPYKSRPRVFTDKHYFRCYLRKLPYQDHQLPTCWKIAE